MLKSLSKKILKSEPVKRIACWIAARYIRLVWFTGSWTYVGKDHFDTLYDNNQPAILAFWHGRLLMAPYSWQKPRPFKMLISGHRDGELIAHTVKHLGISWIKGSSSKGGAAALREMVRVLRAGEWVGITPDGPRGPRMRVSDGILNLARLSGVPIIPMSSGVVRGKVMQTWDRFLIPGPFTKGYVIWGEPLFVPKDVDADSFNEIRRTLEDRLSALSSEADRLTAREPVEPAPETSGQAA